MTSGWSLPDGVRGDAVFSPDGAYRYWLERTWDHRRPTLTFVLLNPSRATGLADDPTTRKLTHISAANGGGGYVLVNLFASVDTHQCELHREGAVGEADVNDRWVSAALRQSARIVVGWGTGSGGPPYSAERRDAILRRVRAVWPMLAGRQLWCTGLNRSGSPRHPGRGVRNDVRLRPFVRTAGYLDDP